MRIHFKALHTDLSLLKKNTDLKQKLATLRKFPSIYCSWIVGKTDPSMSSKRSPQTLLKRVVDVWLFISDQRSAAFMTITALSHHAHIHFAFPGLLEMIKAAGGKPSTEGVSPKESARQWLPRWIDAYPVSARRAMVHAAQMLDSYAGDNDHR